MHVQRFDDSLVAKTPLEERKEITSAEAANEREHLDDALPEPQWSDQDHFCAYCNRVIAATLERQSLQAADREDCRQQVWVDLLATHASGFRGGRLSAWLATLARNKAIDMVRRARRQPIGLAIQELEQEAVAAEESSRSQDVKALVQAALAELELRVERQSFAIFVFRCMDGLSVAQIAVALQLTPEQIRARHHRTKCKFRRIIKRFEDSQDGAGRPRATRGSPIRKSPRDNEDIV